jgi:hypothetical protein
MLAKMDASIEKVKYWRKEMMACLEVTEVFLEKMEARTKTSHESRKVKLRLA